MLLAKYDCTGPDRRCKSCDAAIEWWKTPKGKSLPFNVPVGPYPDHEALTLHWSVCPAMQKDGAPTKPAQAGRDPLEAVRGLAREFGARVVVLLLPEGPVWVSRDGIAAEDIKQDLITAAHTIRREMGGR